MLTDYLGTGYAFGTGRLREAFPAPRNPPERPVHILLITDNDIFSMLDNPHVRQLPNKKSAARASAGEGWQIAKEALTHAGGGGTCVLHVARGYDVENRAGLVDQGWAVHRLENWDEVVQFARDFSRQRFERRAHPGAPHAQRP